jgi:pilus assembly protein CpaE
MTLTALDPARTDQVRRPFLAVCEDSSAAAVRAAVDDPESVLVAAFDDAVAMLTEMPTPEVLLVDLGPGDVRARTERLSAACDADARVVLLGAENDVALYRDLIAAGVADYLVTPVSADSVRAALDAARAPAVRPAQTEPAAATDPDGPSVIAVTGARGGVGATTVAVNLAWSLSHAHEKRVALIDLDLAFGGVALDLDIDPGSGLADALERPDRLDELFVKRAAAPVAPTLRVFASETDPAAAPQPTAEALRALLGHMAADTDVVVLDLPRAVARLDPALFGLADTALIVADPTLKAMRDAGRIKALAAQALRVEAVLNGVGQAPKSELTPSAFEGEAGVRVAARIPFDAGAARTAEAEGVCLTRAARRSKPAKALAALAATLIAPPTAAPAKAGLLSRLTGGRAA